VAMPSAMAMTPTSARKTGRPAGSGGACTPDSPARRVASIWGRLPGHQAKLIRRHPHVFEGAVAADHAARARQLGRRQGRGGQRQGSSPRQRQRAQPTQRSARQAKCAANPPGLGAMTISKSLPPPASSGTTWAGLWEKVAGGVGELQEGPGPAATGPRPTAQEELGDCLFTLVNVARFVRARPGKPA